MDYEDYYWGSYRGYCRDPFPHSLLSTIQGSGSGPSSILFGCLSGLFRDFRGFRAEGAVWLISPFSFKVNLKQ